MVENMLNEETTTTITDQETDHGLFKDDNIGVVMVHEEIHTSDLCLQPDYNSEETIHTSHELEIQKLKEEVFQLRMELKNMNNLRMQEKQQLFDQMKSMEKNVSTKIEAMHESLIKTLFRKLDDMQTNTEATSENIENTHNFLPVGTEMNNSYHLGENIWVDATALKHIRLYSDSASKFVGALVELVYSTEVLKTHTVTGTQCNANKGIPAKPKLCPVRYGVALAEYKRWLKEQMMTDEERKKKLSCFNRYISSKQGTLNSDPLQRPEKRKSDNAENEMRKVRRKSSRVKMRKSVREEEQEENEGVEIFNYVKSESTTP